LGSGAAKKRALLFPASFTLLFAIGISLILVYGRYRLPLLVPLSLLAAAGLARFHELSRQQCGILLGARVAVAAALAWFVYAPVLPGHPVDFFTDYNSQGNWLWEARQYDRALAEYDKALHVRPGVNPGVPLLYLGLGRAYASRGELRRAETLLREGAERFPADREIRKLLEEIRRRP
jgi:tetratricopeptide (TPR) repeat protein